MRRTAVAVMGFGCAIGVFAAGGLSPARASAAGHGPARDHVSRAGSSAIMTKSKHTGRSTSTSATQTVEYDGYSVTVPASWQVFHLDSDPGQCVRYDINAVYLGSPGANQNCPADLIGRGQTITITPVGVAGESSQVSAAGQGGLVQSPPASNTGRSISARTSWLSRMSDYAQDHELRGSVAAANLSVTGTYGSDPAPVAQYLSTLHRAQPIKAGSPNGEPAPTTSPAATPSTSEPAPSSTATSSGTLASALKASIPARPLNGFDACTAPSLNAMRAWKSRYSAAAIYIGGQNMACDYGNLSASWVRSAHAQGWSLLPLYVGLQAPCDSFQDISSATAGAQGAQAAATAIGDAANLGLGKGSPIYYDMESYNNSNTRCRRTVLRFLDAWTRAVHARGYVSGVYSSASTGVADLVATNTLHGHPMTQPDALWFALWDNNNNLTGTPYLPASRWASDRDKQYQGNQNVKVRGYTLNIDADRVGGAVSAP
jgi:hypothetical protein